MSKERPSLGLEAVVVVVVVVLRVGEVRVRGWERGESEGGREVEKPP